MAILQQELGSYDGRDMVRFYGSFQVNGTSDPDLIRDGKKNQITVVRSNTGLFTVTIGGEFPLPERLVYEAAHLSCAAALTAKAQTCHIVRGSYSQAARTFQIVCYTVGDVAGSGYADPVVGDPNDNDRINFELIGSVTSAGVDAA